MPQEEEVYCASAATKGALEARRALAWECGDVRAQDAMRSGGDERA
ncbi:MAG: hypothetical protein ACLTHL_03595 [Collinsella sp.]